MLHGQRPHFISNLYPLAVSRSSLIHPKTKLQRRCLPLRNTLGSLQTIGHFDQRTLILHAVVVCRAAVLDVRGALGRGEIDLVRTGGNPPIEVEYDLGFRPPVLLIVVCFRSPEVVERNGHRARRHVLHRQPRLGLGAHLPIRTLHRNDYAHASVDAGAQHRSTEGNAIPPRGDERYVLIPSVPVVISLPVLAVLRQHGL
mmetsp:Transcript_24550/g.37356  ORF Transcript_24550/g.37356 Transcript_24550/m.37356 type:complete len:200 (-) Transcript_24550:128-727(-)